MTLFEANGNAINAASILPRMLRDFGDIGSMLAAIVPRNVLAAAPVGNLDRKLTNLTKADKPFSQNPDILLDWLS